MGIFKQLVTVFGFSEEEPEDKQAADFRSSLVGANRHVNPLPDCDEIKGGSGPFGECATNPIPVNGPIGISVYLSRLRTGNGVLLFWHSLGTAMSSIYPYPLDVYELVAGDASEWRTLYFASHHRRRSLKVPLGLTLEPWRPKDMPAVAWPSQHESYKTGATGDHHFVDNFPFGLPSVIDSKTHLRKILPSVFDTRFTNGFAAFIQASLDKHAGKWVRPNEGTITLLSETPNSVKTSIDLQLLLPEDIGEWLVGQQRAIFAELQDTPQSEDIHCSLAEMSTDGLIELSCNVYAMQVALVALTFHQHIDDSKFISGPKNEGIDFLQFLSRIQSKARRVSKPYAIADSPQFDPVSVAGCLLDAKHLAPKVLLFYGALLSGAVSLMRAVPEAVRFGKTLLGLSSKTKRLDEALALAYFFAYKDVLTRHGWLPSPDQKEPHSQLAGVILRNWTIWGNCFRSFQSRLMEFTGKRKISF